ncbi:MAG: hypothetical protein NT159_21945 [Proteobacteria bacterium]|nr:hypothetical protein [Pseudomonadota bacterium]
MSAVPVNGVMAAKAGVVVKVTTALGTAEPAAFRIVAVTLAGLPGLIFVTAAPVAGLVKTTDTVAALWVAITLRFTLPETGVPFTVAVAVMVAAPAAVGVAAAIWIEALPVASVTALPEAGYMVISEAAVVKVTTVFGTPFPDASLTEAYTFTRSPVWIELTSSVSIWMLPVTPVPVGITPNPALADKEAPPTEADAVIVAAPAAVGLAALIWMEATPEASVSAVPVAGIIDANVAAVVKVTTTLGTTAPEVSRRVTDTLAGLPVPIFVTAAPVTGLVNAMLIPVAPVLVASTPKPALTVRVAPPTEAVAEMFVAPAAVGLAPMTWIEAAPTVSVSAVPEAGIIVARLAEVVNVTTVFGTRAPDGSLTVAVTLAALLVLILVTVAPVTGSVKAIEMLPLSVLNVVSALPLTQPVSPRTTPQHSTTAKNLRIMELNMFGRIVFRSFSG